MGEKKKKIIRAVTVSMSFTFLKGVMKELNQKYEMVALSSAGPEQQELAESDGVRCITLEMARHISLKQDVKSLCQMIKTLRREKPYMVHSMTPKAGLISMIAAWLCGVSVRIHTFTGLVFPTSTGLKRRILMFTDWLTCACATHVIAEGQGVKNDLVNNGITKKNVRVLGYGNVKGIDLNVYSRSEEVMSRAEELRSDKFTFLTVGRVVGDKGINEMVAAFKRLNGEYPDTRLVLVGGYEETLDPVKSETKAEIDSNDAIEAVGAMKDVRPWYAASDVYISASYREGFPNTVIEAGAMGLPCVVTDINGSREIIHDGENGVIIPSKSEDALYESMKRIYINNVERERMAKNARPMIASRYEQSFVRQCLYDFYDEVMK